MLRAILVLSLILVVASCTSGSSLAPGNLAPQFTLTSLSGEKLSSSSFAGKVVLLNFWASWCGPCVEEMPALEALYTRLKGRGFLVVAVGMNDEEVKLKEFSERLGLSFPILVDKDGVVSDMYKVSGVPESFLLDKEGKLILMPDPQDNTPSVRIVGPRSWDSPRIVAIIERVLSL